MVSLERAAQCIGRKVIHSSRDLDGKLITGAVIGVTSYDVHVKHDDGDASLCIPANLTWESALSPSLASAILNWEPMHSAQVGFAPQVFRDDPVQGFPDEGFLLGVVYSSGIANDDGQDRPLIAVAPLIRRAWPLSITVHPFLAHEIEELLEWVKP